MELQDAIRSRRSHRQYRPEKPARELVDAVLEAARWAPSSCNLQLTEYLVVDDPELVKKLGERVNGKFKWAGVYIFLIYDPRFTVKRHAAVTSLGAAMQNILLAATEKGLGACPMAGFGKDAAAKSLLGIPAPYEIAVAIALGYSSDAPEKERERLGLDRVRHWNRWHDTGNLLNDDRKLSAWSWRDIRNYRERMAPVYLYRGHHSLNVFAPSVYDAAAKICATHASSATRWLDLFTYDGAFFRAFTGRVPAASATISDVIPFPLRVHAGEHPGIRTAPIGESGGLPEGTFDLVTCMHKLEFSVGHEQVLAQAAARLAPGGRLFVTTTAEAGLKRWARALRMTLLRARGETVNVYENSPTYKIGPFAARRPADIRAALASSGLQLRAEGRRVVPGSGRFAPHRFWWGVFERPNT